VQVAISTRHGSLTPTQQAQLEERAQKLLKIFGRLMSVEFAVEERKNDWQVEILASAEHKHDFVALERAPTPEAAADLCLHKIESQLRRYKEKVQDRRVTAVGKVIPPAEPATSDIDDDEA
jgi:putative sigma-54 modulation protein